LFDLTVTAGRPDLRLDGYLGEHLAISRSFSSNPDGDRLGLWADDTRLVADGVDATRVVFAATDRFGAPRPFVGGEVSFSVDGPGEVIGDNPFAFGDAGGAGAVWARTRAGQAGEIRLQAHHERLGTAAVTIGAGPAQP
jgi:beta-galactosidase